MGTVDQIFDPVFRLHIKKLLHMVRKVLRLQAEVNLDLVLVFFPQAVYAAAVFRQVLRLHAHVGVIAGREVGPWVVVGKAQDINAGVNGALYDMFIVAHGVFTAVGMGMVIGFHSVFASFFGDLIFTWESGLRSAALAI